MKKICALILAACMATLLTGCAEKSTSDTDELVYISPHKDHIKSEFESAFKTYYKEQTGRDVRFVARSIDGGGSSILNYLRNVYSTSESSGIDLLWGTGENPHISLESEGLLEPLELSADIYENIPAEFGGMRMYSKGKCWYGTVLSSFGMVYNKELLKALELPSPTKWSDISHKQFYGKIILADPSKSSSMAATFEMMVQSADNWQEGWQRVIAILGNAKKFLQSSSDVADAPVVGDAVVSTCVDYYGIDRASRTPKEIGYISPPGETGYTPDPISMLKNAPHKEVAKAFIEFILSRKGQALWALPAGAVDGPKTAALNRTPIRKDVFDVYKDSMPDYVPNPYASKTPLELDGELREVRYDVLVYLVKAAAIDNTDLLKKARKAVHEKPELMGKFATLPENIDTVEEIYELHTKLKDNDQRHAIVSEWSKHFRTLYSEIIEN